MKKSIYYVNKKALELYNREVKIYAPIYHSYEDSMYYRFKGFVDCLLFSGLVNQKEYSFLCDNLIRVSHKINKYYRRKR